jgi:hypothetical protein
MWIRRLSVDHPVVKQGQPFTHMCIKPMPHGRTGCGKFITMNTRKKNAADCNRQ